MKKFRDLNYLEEQRELFLRFAREVGFPRRLGLTDREYSQSVSIPPAQPPEFEDRHPILLPVEGRIDGLSDLCQLVYGQRLVANEERIGNYYSIPHHYWIYTSDGVNRLDEVPLDFHRSLRIVERGLTALEGFSLFIHSEQVREIMKCGVVPGWPFGYSIALPGSPVKGSRGFALLVEVVDLLPGLLTIKAYRSQPYNGIGTCGVLGGELRQN